MACKFILAHFSPLAICQTSYRWLICGWFSLSHLATWACRSVMSVPIFFSLLHRKAMALWRPSISMALLLVTSLLWTENKCDAKRNKNYFSWFHWSYISALDTSNCPKARGQEKTVGPCLKIKSHNNCMWQFRIPSISSILSWINTTFIFFNTSQCHFFPSIVYHIQKFNFMIKKLQWQLDRYSKSQQFLEMRYIRIWKKAPTLKTNLHQLDVYDFISCHVH